MNLPQACAEIQQRCDKATAGPWSSFGEGVSGPDQRGYSDVIASYTRGVDSDFIAHARSDIPLLLRAVAELQAENKLLAEAVAAEREACCKDVCPFCADGRPIRGAEWHAWDRPNVVDGMMRYTVACKAAAIRTRAAAQSGEGKDNG